VATQKRAVLIAGPTASGKSALALERARQMDALIVNADALQVYGGLRVLTARPGLAETAAVPHALYGFVPPSVRFSAGAWAAAAARTIAELDGRLAVFVGGTGLYFEALTNGIADVPTVPAAIVAEIEAELAGLDAAGRHRLLAARDPEMARRLRAPDPQRVARALAVLKATGKSLARFQDRPQRGLLEGFAVERLVLDSPRDLLASRIAARFERMLDEGAVEEVAALAAQNLDSSLPAMKAIGVREITGWLSGVLTRDEAVEAAVIATRRFAKRQRTWFRGRMADWTWLESVAPP
jgi:tRNA dimethylallyltransferase